jgi:O-antigen/teichoic acid export membrane protein
VVFTFTLLLARWLGPDDFGRWGWATSYALLTSVWSDPGIGLAMTKLVATSDGERQMNFVATGFTIRLILTGIVFTLALLPFTFVPYMRENAFVFIVVLVSEQMRNMALYFCSVFRGRQRNKFEAIAMGTERIGALALTWPLLQLGFGIRAVAFVYVVARGTSLVVAVAENVRAFGWRPIGVDRSLMSRISAETLPMAVLIICERTNMSLPPLLVKAFGTEHALGIFNAAFKTVFPAVLMCTAVAGSLYAPMAERFQSDPAQSARLYRNGIRGLMHLLLPPAVITLLLSSQVTILLYGPEYVSSAPILRMLTPYFLAMIFITVNHLFLPAINRGRVVAVVSVVSLVVNVGLGLLFISRWGAEGAGLSMAMAQGVSACVYVTMAHRFGKAGLALREWFTMAAAFLLAGGALYLARPYLIGPGVSLLLERMFEGRHLLMMRAFIEVVEGAALSVIVYLSFLFGLGGVSVEERRMFAAVARRLRPAEAA